MGRNRVHELNREHVAAPVAEALAGLRLALWKRFRDTLVGWNPKPVDGESIAARGDVCLSKGDHRRRRTTLFQEISRDGIQVAGETSAAAQARGGARIRRSRRA
jgi:hypothetical protein